MRVLSSASRDSRVRAPLLARRACVTRAPESGEEREEVGAQPPQLRSGGGLGQCRTWNLEGCVLVQPPRAVAARAVAARAVAARVEARAAVVRAEKESRRRGWRRRGRRGADDGGGGEGRQRRGRVLRPSREYIRCEWQRDAVESSGRCSRGVVPPSRVLAGAWPGLSQASRRNTLGGLRWCADVCVLECASPRPRRASAL